MLYAIWCIDRAAGADEARRRHQIEHRRYLESMQAKIRLAGPLTEDDGERRIGSLFVIDVEDRAAADAFSRADPFCDAGVWERV
jgi:uncharacterized protein YciI